MDNGCISKDVKEVKMKEKVYVLQVLEGLHAGGMETLIMNYLRQIDHTSVQIDFLVFSGPSHYDEEVESLGSTIYRLTPRRTNPIKNYWEIDRFFSRHLEYSIVHIHQGITYFKPLNSAYKHKVPIRIVHSHGIDIRYRTKLRWFYHHYAIPHICKMATNYFACSDDAAKQMFDTKIIDSKAYYLMKNAIDIQRFSFNFETRREMRQALHIEGKHVIGHIGRFDYAKNHDFLIRLFSEVNKVDTDSLLLLIGTGENYEAIQKKVDEYGLKEKVLFLGVRDDVHRLLQAIDVFVLPSRFEGIPFVGIEAQAAGLPCIFSTNVDRNIDVTETSSFLSLTDSIDNWVEQVLSAFQKDRISVTRILADKGYDIKVEAKKLERFYLRKGEPIDR